MLLLLPWRVKVDEDRLHRKLLRAADRMLAGTSRYLERDAVEPAPPRVAIVYSSALMAYHQADVLVKVSLDRVTADEASASSEVTAKLSYVLECRTTDYGRMVPWAAGAVEASKSPFRQIGAAEAVWGSDPGEAAFSLSPAQAPGRTTVRNFQYVHPIDDLQAEAIEDAIVRIVGDIGEVEFQPSLNADFAALGLSVDFLQTPRARRRGRPSDGAVGRQISDVRLSGDQVILEVELHNPLPTLRVGGRVEFQVDADSGARGRAALVRSAPFLLAPHETRRVSVSIPAARVGVPPEATGGRPVGALMSLQRGTQCFVEGVRLLSFRNSAELAAEGARRSENWRRRDERLGSVAGGWDRFRGSSMAHQVNGKSLAMSKVPSMPVTPTRPVTTVQLLRHSSSVKPLILQTTQKPLSFIHETAMAPEPIAVAK